MDDSFLTLATTSEALYKEKGSKFLSFALPVKTEEEVKMNLELFKKKYFDSRHICFAFMLGKDQQIFRTNDAGEPNHSAGDPILGQIRSNNLTDVLVVVVRYFGGTKLGISGLIQAYKTAAALAISNNQIITAIMKEQIILNFAYPSLNEIMRVVKDFELDIVTQNFDLDCQMVLLVRQQLLDQVCAIFENIPDVRLQMNV